MEHLPVPFVPRLSYLWQLTMVTNDPRQVFVYRGLVPDKTWVRAIQIKTVIKIAKGHTIASIRRQVWVSNFRPKRRRRITLLRVR